MSPAKNDPAMERLYEEARALGLTGEDGAFVVQKDERGIIRLVQRTMKRPVLESIEEEA